MNGFEFQCATKMIFGKDRELCVGEELKKHGAGRVLMVYGGSSIKRSGLYDRVTEALREAGLFFLELPGVVPNPRVSLVRQGIAICRKEKIDFLLAVGGGSVIDTCKAISFGVYYEGDVWDLISGKVKPGEDRIPVADILTLPAAGSEESDSCVISDETLSVKTGFGSPLMRPVFSIMNPELTYTLPLQPHSAVFGWRTSRLRPGEPSDRCDAAGHRPPVRRILYRRDKGRRTMWGGRCIYEAEPSASFYQFHQKKRGSAGKGETAGDPVRYPFYG